MPNFPEEEIQLFKEKQKQELAIKLGRNSYIGFKSFFRPYSKAILMEDIRNMKAMMRLNEKIYVTFLLHFIMQLICEYSWQEISTMH